MNIGKHFSSRMKMIKNRRRLAASSSSWTALMRSQGLPPSPGALSTSIPKLLSLEFHFSHPQLEPKVQQRRHPYSPPADSGKMEHNLKHDNNFHQYAQAILAGRLAPGAHVIVTSRPHTLTYLQVANCFLDNVQTAFDRAFYPI